VLKRDGTNVTTNSACSATAGSWYSPYDGATWVRVKYVWKLTPQSSEKTALTTMLNGC
jgi:hypothetical protein